uniref:Uncharacterized protein n=1 Tax=Anguilla anguilla TaxID=7936 RepID=A0A0E9TSF6_ANGAN
MPLNKQHHTYIVLANVHPFSALPDLLCTVGSTAIFRVTLIISSVNSINKFSHESVIKGHITLHELMFFPYWGLHCPACSDILLRIRASES